MPGKNGVGRDFLAATVGAARRNAMNDVDIYLFKRGKNFCHVLRNKLFPRLVRGGKKNGGKKLKGYFELCIYIYVGIRRFVSQLN